MSTIADRKKEHLDVVLKEPSTRMQVATGLDAVRFVHEALPEMALDDVDLATTFVGRAMAAPLLISSMTGGPAAAGRINAHLAEAAGALGIAFAVGSQRIALEGRGAEGFDRSLRTRVGASPLLANLGAAQLATMDGADAGERAVEMIGADALIIHLNPLQEAVQPGGDRNWRGLLAEIERLSARVTFPIVAKEVGNGISGATAQRLVNAGVSVIDVAGAGGTSWAAVEGARAADPQVAALGQVFRDWGIPTAAAIRDVRTAVPSVPIVASGGIRDGLDAARAIRLGADVVGQAAGVLAAALESPEAVMRHFEGVVAALRIVCFCTGSRDLAALRRAPLVGGDTDTAA